MNNEKTSFLKRICAYLIDLIFVTLLASVVALIFIDNTKYQGESEELMDITKKYTSGEISKEEYTKQFDELNYFMTKDSVGVTIVNCSVSLVYFVILCYFCHGITLGKYLMKLRIVSSNGKKLNMGHYLIRALFINLILSNVVSVVLVTTLSKDSFVSIYPKVSNVFTVFILATILFIMYRNDGRGLHDLMANTKIVSTKGVNNIEEPEEKKDEVVDAKVIEEKTTEKKKTGNKKSTKSGKKIGSKK